MAGWLSRAKSLFQQAPPAPEPFVVECDCGGKVSGVRTNNYLKPACPECSMPVFVLPANVYPRPKSAAKAIAAAPSTGKSGRPPTSVVIDEAPPVAAKNGIKSESKQARDSAPQLPTAILKDSSRRIVTPLRALGFTIFVASVLTFVGVWHRTSVEQAKATVAKATDLGKEALQEHDFTKAETELGRARAALDLLKRHDAAANDVRQLSREATAMSRIVGSPLIDVLQETLAARVPGSTQPLAMSSLNQGAWIIFDTKLITDAEHQGRYQIDAPLDVNEINIEIVIESSIFESLSDRDEFGETNRVIFAAQLDQMTQPSGDPAASTLTLNGRTAFLWANYNNYVAIGFHPGDDDAEKQTRSVLERQAEALQKN